MTQVAAGSCGLAGNVGTDAHWAGGDGGHAIATVVTSYQQAGLVWSHPVAGRTLPGSAEAEGCLQLRCICILGLQASTDFPSVLSCRFGNRVAWFVRGPRLALAPLLTVWSAAKGASPAPTGHGLYGAHGVCNQL